MNSIAHSISDGCSTPVLGTINVGLKYTSYKVHISLSKLCPGPRKIIGRDRRHAFRSSMKKGQLPWGQDHQVQQILSTYYVPH